MGNSAGGYVFVEEKETSRQKPMLATLKRNILIDLDVCPRCVEHLECQDSQYCNPLTLTYVILLAYQQTILSPRGRQVGQRWPPLLSLYIWISFVWLRICTWQHSHRTGEARAGWILQVEGYCRKMRLDLSEFYQELPPYCRHFGLSW